MNKKLCCFYVNDIHLVTMLLPYINERINQDTKIITILETDISESAQKVMNGIQGKKSKELLNIEWNNKDLTCLYDSDIQDKLVLVCGNEDYIKRANIIINEKNDKCTILNCYEMVQSKEKLEEILDKHDMVVNTSGERYPEDLFTGYTQKSYKEITV